MIGENEEGFQPSFAQQRLWFLEQLTPGNPVYNIPAGARLTGPLDMDALRRAVTEIVRRHEALRTRFTGTDQLTQVVVDPFPVDIPVVDLPATGMTDSWARAVELARDAVRRPFDLTRTPLLRMLVIRLAPDDHLLALSVHHIVSDGWSLGVFLDELATLYAAFVAGVPSPLPELPIQYVDFAHWQRERLHGERLEELLRFWREHLSGAPPGIALPSDHRRPPAPSFRGARTPVVLSAEHTDSLRHLCSAENATLFIGLLAAFGALLHRYTGEQDLVIGCPTAGRVRTELHPLLGCFVNTLPMRVDLTEDPTFRELLRRVREVAVRAYAHEELPFEMLVERLRTERDLSRHPVFHTALVLHNTTPQPLHLPGVQTSRTELDTGTAKFDLTLSLENLHTGLSGYLEYSRDLFLPDTAKRMTKHLIRLLIGAITEPDTRISALALHDDEDRQTITSVHKRPPRDESPACLHTLFEEQAKATPNTEAVTFGQRSLTYRELDTRAEMLARRLRKLGVAPDVPVGLCVQRSLEMVVGILGILKAGGAYLPLDPSYPRDRLDHMVRDAAVRIIVAQQQTTTAVPAADTIVTLNVDSPPQDVTDPAPAEHRAPLSAENLAYVMYTSGSTGVPKAVLVTHRNVCRLIQTTSPQFGVSPNDVWTVLHSYAFDFSVWELWGALLSGGRAVIVPDETVRSPELLVDLLREQRVTVLSQTPSGFRRLAAATEGRDLPLRLVIFGGERLDPRDARGWCRPDDSRPVMINMYGITETTVHVTRHHLIAEDLDSDVSVIGEPLPHLRVHLLDSRLHPVPVGVVGELYVAGDGVARGYLNRPGITAERFVPDPFGEVPGGRLYRTGDTARRLANGQLVYVGRTDTQVKIRGFRVELGEVETALAGHWSVEQAVVVATMTTARDRSLVAYVVPRPGARPTVTDLRSFLRSRLPDYMLPSAYVMLDALPRTPNGKVDRRALPAPDTARPPLQSRYVAARTPLEDVLCSVWADVLDVDTVGVDDNFFELGGDSMRSIQLRAAALERGVCFTLEQLFRNQTIAELAAEITRAGATHEPPQRVQPYALISDEDRARLPNGVVDAYPMTQLQTGMIFHSELNPDSAHFYDVDSFHFQGPFEVEPFTQALQRLGERHAVLRTGFDLVRFHEPLQLVHERCDLPFDVVDIQEVPPDEQEQLLAAWRETERHRRFSWQQPPMLRVTVHRRSEKTFQLTIVFHHSILDGWSLFLLLRELFDDYAALRRGQRSHLATPLDGTFGDYVASERAALESAEQRDFWLSAIGDAEATTIGFSDLECAPGDGGGIVNIEVPIPERVSDGLRSLARDLSIPLKSVLLAAHIRVLGVAAGRSDVITGLVTHGRLEQPGGDRMLGLFLNTLPLRMDLDGGSWADLARACFAAELRAFPHRRYPMAELRRHLGRPPFQAVFNFTNYHLVKGLTGWADVTYLDSYSDQRTDCTFLAEFALHPLSDDVRLHVSYHIDQVGSMEANSACRYYQAVLAAMVADPEAPYASCPLLTDSEADTLTRVWNHTDTSYSRGSTIHALIEAQAARSPNAVAVICASERMSYVELNSRANRLAQRLRRHGVGPDTLVGVCIGRSPDLVVAMLAVLKAGGAYVSLDPDHPAQRLAFIVSDANLALVLTHASIADKLDKCGCPTLPIDRQDNTVEAVDDPPDSGVSAKNLAYLIYTSGSSGTPKAVGIEHRGAVNLLCWVVQHLPTEELTGVLAATSVYFDCTLFEIFAPLCHGGTAVLISSIIDLPALDEAEHVRTIGISPSALAELLQAGGIPPSVRTICVAGEVFPGALARAVHRDTSVSTLYNLYGPSEYTTYATVETVAADTKDRVPIGRPIANTRVHILDRKLQPVPPGAPGEMYLAGSGLARGYLGQPALTAERFVPDPFATEPDSRMYRTGDLARWTPDGRLDYLGRVDEQVKLRGYRIEPGEIEAVLEQHPGIERAAVIARTDLPPARSLVAYIVPAAESPGHDELTSHLADRLPRHMVPTVFVPLARLPMTANNKLDRRALPPPGREHGPAAGDHTPPRTPTEATMTEIWQDVLDIQPLGVHTDFFQLGGTSLQALQVTSRASVALNVDLPVRLLFEQPTIARLAAAAEHRPPRGHTHEASPDADHHDVAPPSAQRLPGLTMERRPLLTLHAAGRLEPVHAAAICALPAGLTEHTGLAPDTITEDVLGRMPLFSGIYHTSLGRIATLMIPWFDVQLYTNQAGLLETLTEALKIADTLGARTVSLTDLIASATDYGRALADATRDHGNVPRITTGHATTASTVVLTVQRLLNHVGRDITDERVGFLGLGSIGTATLRLILSRLPHPQEIILCDVYGKRSALDQLGDEIIALGFTGPVRILDSQAGDVPPDLYDSTLIIGATNVADVLNVDSLVPGTIIADDSGPHCFPAHRAIHRFEHSGDIVFTRAGQLSGPDLIEETRYLPPALAKRINPALLAREDPNSIEGCIFSALLSACFDDIKPTIGHVDRETCVQHYDRLVDMGFHAGALQCTGYLFTDRSLEEFRDRYGHDSDHRR